MAPNSSPFTKEELEAIFPQLENKNHYEILSLKPTAGSDEVATAFHEQAIHFHPDQYDIETDRETLELTKKIYTKIVEAYRVLSDDKRRRAYDDQLSGRVDMVNASTNVAPKQKPTPGNRFFELARQSFNSNDLKTAKMNIQIALSSDAQNPVYLHLQKRIEAGLARKKA